MLASFHSLVSEERHRSEKLRSGGLLFRQAKREEVANMS